MCCVWGSGFGSCKIGCRWLGAEELNGVSQLSEVLRGGAVGMMRKTPAVGPGLGLGFGAGRWAS